MRTTKILLMAVLMLSGPTSGYAQCTPCQENTLVLLFGGEDEILQQVDVPWGMSALFRCSDPRSLIVDGEILINGVPQDQVTLNKLIFVIITLRVRVDDSHDGAHVQCVAELDSFCERCASNEIIIHVTRTLAPKQATQNFPANSNTTEEESELSQSSITEKSTQIESNVTTNGTGNYTKEVEEVSSTKLPSYGVVLLVILVIAAVLIAASLVIVLLWKICKDKNLCRLNNKQLLNMTSFSNGACELDSSSSGVVVDTAPENTSENLSYNLVPVNSPQPKQTGQDIPTNQLHDDNGLMAVEVVKEEYVQRGTSLKGEGLSHSEKIAESEEPKLAQDSSNTTQEKSSHWDDNVLSEANCPSNKDIIASGDLDGSVENAHHKDEHHGHMESGQATNSDAVYCASPGKKQAGEQYQYVQESAINLQDNVHPGTYKAEFTVSHTQMSGHVYTDLTSSSNKNMSKNPPRSAVHRSGTEPIQAVCPGTSEAKTPDYVGTSNGTRSNKSDPAISIEMECGMKKVLPMGIEKPSINSQSINSDKDGPAGFSTTTEKLL